MACGGMPVCRTARVPERRREGTGKAHNQAPATGRCSYPAWIIRSRSEYGCGCVLQFYLSGCADTARRASFLPCAPTLPQTHKHTPTHAYTLAGAYVATPRRPNPPQKKMMERGLACWAGGMGGPDWWVGAGGGLTLNQSRKETVALQGETAAAYVSRGKSP